MRAGAVAGAPAERPDSARRTRVFRTRRRVAINAMKYGFVLAALAFFILPLLWLVSTSFKLPGEYLHNPPIWFPNDPTLVHYGNVMDAKGAVALRNSVTIAGTATALCIVVGTLAAYSLARFQTGGKHLAFWLLSQRLLPPVVLVVPFFLLLRDVGEVVPFLGLDTRGALIVLYAAFNLPYVIWMMRSYFEGVPAEVEEAAMVDGCTRWGVLWRIALPMAMPGLVATATFAFIFAWTEFLFAVVITRTNAVTLPVAISGFTGSQGSNWGQASALAVVATAPVFLLGLLVQRHFVRGLTLGAVRG